MYFDLNYLPQQKIVDDKNELYSKNLKTKTLPEINRDQWASFLSIWDAEVLAYLYEQYGSPLVYTWVNWAN